MEVLDLPNVATNQEYALSTAIFAIFLLFGSLLIVYAARKIRRLRRLSTGPSGDANKILVNGIVVVIGFLVVIFWHLREGVVGIAFDENNVYVRYRLRSEKVVPWQDLRSISLHQLPYRVSNEGRRRKPGWVITITTTGGKTFTTVAVESGKAAELERVYLPLSKKGRDKGVRTVSWYGSPLPSLIRPNALPAPRARDSAALDPVPIEEDKGGETGKGRNEAAPFEWRESNRPKGEK